MDFETLADNRKNGMNRIVWIGCAILLVVVIILETVILNSSGSASSGNEDKKPAQTTKKPSQTSGATVTPTGTPEPTPYIYINESQNTIESRFNPPEGYKRVDVATDSFGYYLRNYSLLKYGEKSRTYNGFINDDAPTLGVLDQFDDVVNDQQCADTAIMLFAEYLFSQERYDEIKFEFSSGFMCEFSKWVQGYRVTISGKNVSWVDKKGTAGVKENDYSYENFLSYLYKIYQYANTDSLVHQFKKKDATDIAPGDIIVAPYSQLKIQAAKQGLDTSKIGLGHAMLVADVAVNANGDKVFLLVEGTTPATTPYVVEDPNNLGCMWFSFDENGEFVKSTSGLKWQNTWIYSFENK